MNNAWIKDKNQDRIDHQIDNIFEYFSFDKIHKIMHMLGWAWASSHGIPTVDEIEKFAEDQLREVAKEYIARKEDSWYISCGGFKSTCTDGVLTLEFIADDWSFCGDSDDDLEDSKLEK